MIFEENAGRCPNPLKKLLERSFLRIFKNFWTEDVFGGYIQG